MIPNGNTFWSFLKGMAVDGVCISCKAGSGNPGCEVRKCAKEKDIEICALCDNYPCELFEKYFNGYPILKSDNSVLRENGMDVWLKLQNERQTQGFTYAENDNE